jgi:hypothetical protein
VGGGSGREGEPAPETRNARKPVWPRAQWSMMTVEIALARQSDNRVFRKLGGYRSERVAIPALEGAR